MIRKLALCLILLLIVTGCELNSANDNPVTNVETRLYLSVVIPSTMNMELDLGVVGPFGSEATIAAGNVMITNDLQEPEVQWTTSGDFPTEKTHLVISAVVPSTMNMTLDLGEVGPFKGETTIDVGAVAITNDVQYPDFSFITE